MEMRTEVGTGVARRMVMRLVMMSWMGIQT